MSPAIVVSPDNARKVMQTWRQYPDTFMHDVLGADPWWKQVEILYSVRDNDRTAVRSCNAVGKDWLAARATLWWLMCHEEAVVVTTAPSFHQIRDIIWREIHAAYAMSKIPLGPEPPNKTEFSLGPKRYAIGLSSNEKERLTGIHAENVLIIVTEVSGMEDENLDALDTLTAGGNTRVLYISNPTRVFGTFYHAFHDHRALYETIHIPAWETPNFAELGITIKDIRSGEWREKSKNGVPRPYLITPKWVAEKYVKWGEESQYWQAYIDAEFPEGGDKHLIPLSVLEAAVDNVLDDLPPYKFLGVDVARGGSNRTVFTLMQGGRVLEQQEVGGSKSGITRTTETRDRIVGYVKRHGDRSVLVAVDDSVTGDVPVILRRQGRWIDVVPIASLHKKDSLIYGKHKGLEVLSGEGWTSILHSRRHRVKKPIYDLISVDGRTKITGDHSLMVQGIETRAQDIGVGTIIDTYPVMVGDPSGTMEEELAWALGLFAAEGSVHANPANQNFVARIANTDISLLTRAKLIFEAHFCEPCSIGMSSRRAGVVQKDCYARKDCYFLRLGDRATDFVAQFAYVVINRRPWVIGEGRTTQTQYHKKVPIQILNGPSKAKLAWIEGYLNGDGYVDARECKVDSVSMTLLAGLQVLWNSMECATRVRVRGDKLNITTLALVQRGEGAPGQVKIVRPLGIYDDYVYDLETASHTFVAGLGYLVHHNTGIGGGIVDDLEELGYAPIPFLAGERAEEPKLFANNGSEAYWRLREAFLNHEISIPGHLETKDRMLAQLSKITYKADHGPRQVILIHKQGGDGKAILDQESPDLADSLNISWYAQTAERGGDYFVC